jgi:hypothetical protein
MAQDHEQVETYKNCSELMHILDIERISHLFLSTSSEQTLLDTIHNHPNWMLCDEYGGVMIYARVDTAGRNGRT